MSTVLAERQPWERSITWGEALKARLAKQKGGLVGCIVPSQRMVGDDIIGSSHNTWRRLLHIESPDELRGGDMYRALVAEGVIKAKRNPMRGIDAVRVLRQPQKVASEPQVARGARSRDADTALMVAVLATTGARCAEAAALRREDVDEDGAGITVLGKGGKRRWVPVQDPRVGRALLARPSGYVWPGRFGGHVHEATLRRKVRESTGVPPHALRRRFASQAYDGTGDLLALQMLLGHASPATTELYVRLDRKRLRSAAGAAALPDDPAVARLPKAA